MQQWSQRRQASEGGEIYTVMTDSVWRKPSQHCKTIMLQLKNIFFKRLPGCFGAWSSRAKCSSTAEERSREKLPWTEAAIQSRVDSEPCRVPRGLEPAPNVLNEVSDILRALAKISKDWRVGEHLHHRSTASSVKVKDGDFPGGPAVKEPSFQGKGHGFEPWLGS